MIQRPCPRSSQSAPPHDYLFSLTTLPVGAPPPPPQNVFVKAAAVDDLDSSLEYILDAKEFPEVAANTVVLVDAACQYSRPLLAAASPNPLIGVRVTGVFEAVIGNFAI